MILLKFVGKGNKLDKITLLINISEIYLGVIKVVIFRKKKIWIYFVCDESVSKL